MNLLDIIGPVMVGPSSSHTAGAVKIGRVCHKLLAEKVVRADIFFHGSFLATGKGHGTDKAVVAGLLGMQVDDPAIPHSFEIAEREGLRFTLSGIDLSVASATAWKDSARPVPRLKMPETPFSRNHRFTSATSPT